MRDEQSQSKNEIRLANKDITPILKGWDYEPGTINVRKVIGMDGSPKLQMRLALGLFQMEMTGAPMASIPTDAIHFWITSRRSSRNITPAMAPISVFTLMAANANSCVRRRRCIITDT